MHPLLSKTAAALVVSALAQGVAQAALFAVDPGPYVPANGSFAAWYQDTHGRTLELCLSKAVSSRVPSAPGAPTYMCNLLPAPGIFDDAQPLVFPTNFPDEAFWFTGDGTIVDAARGIDLTYVSAVEAAFSGGDPIEGDQISFARIRIRVDVPTAGTYVITHPYGVDVFNVDTPGRRAINMTRDIGIGVPKTYDGALKGDVGPFLRSINGPYTETNPLTGSAEQFVGDPNLVEAFTGSPFNTNYIRIEGPNGLDLRTTVMAISGKLATMARPTPMITQRSTYSRKPGASAPVAQQDVFVLAPPPPAKVTLDSNNPVLNLTEANTTGSWYAQSSTNPSLPSTLQVTADNHLAIASSTPTTLPMPLTDLVVISRAEYSLSTGQITVVASTSDETSPPVLTATSGTGVAIGALSGDGAVKSLATGISPIPPAKVRVTSSNGGSDTEEVVIVQ
ncbi:hypothetical protein V466_18455 [Pseudomonas mandelii PD30]|uniref:Glycoprotein gp2 n=1 Tax=Pseudomonas mandelii PD30 TaxID=1419583 RepID=A0A059KZY8_9PSED|nr:hypothetical protein [Pseudomonas mandelii]KDD67551.1 hypothetical protein V466_18455 [Pseudomonas mandelii PD30]